MLTSSPQQATAQYILTEQQPQQQQQEQEQQQQQQQGSEDMFFALERLLMGISPFPPTIPTLAKPTCPSLDDQIMAEIQATSSPTTSPSSIPSIILNEQSLDLLQQQFYQSQGNNAAFQFQQDQSDCSTSRSGSPPSSPYSYASSLVSSPAMSLMDNNNNSMSSDLLWISSNNNNNNNNNNNATMVAQQQDWDFSLFDTMSLPLTMTTLENYIAPSAAENTNTFLSQPQQQMQTTSQQPLSLNQATTKKVKSHQHHRRSSSACSGISAYESTAHRQHRASSISSVCSAASTTTTTSNSSTTAVNARPVKSYACSTCTKPFPTRTQLKSHMAIHTDSFPFPCMYTGCELHFKRKHDLRRHVDAKHAIVKKYICTGGCGEGFGRRDQMVRHLRRGTCGQGQGFQTE
ncbi:hypothetical protein BGZ65_007867 [Modicella reniformis]|uniref:C2H2-type domain-containing protein n=1 Tax=Modicella reniformis TaxID=1440133 RepID=A0A9P6SSE9_9FUNG|nr:hypothetical protein BGZ65_007867 [Modicella reniformis]